MIRPLSIVTSLVFGLATVAVGPAFADDGNKGDEYRKKKYMRKMKEQHDGDRDWDDDWNRHKGRMESGRKWQGKRDHDDKNDCDKRKRRKMKKMEHRNKLHHLYMKAKKHLDLSSEQRSELSDLYFETKMTLIDLKAQKKKQHLRLKRYMHGDNSSRSEVLDTIDQLYGTKASIKKTRVEFKMDVKNELNTDQWSKLKKTMKRGHKKQSRSHRSGSDRGHK